MTATAAIVKIILYVSQLLCKWIIRARNLLCI